MILATLPPEALFQALFTTKKENPTDFESVGFRGSSAPCLAEHEHLGVRRYQSVDDGPGTDVAGVRVRRTDCPGDLGRHLEGTPRLDAQLAH